MMLGILLVCVFHFVLSFFGTRATHHRYTQNNGSTLMRERQRLVSLHSRGAGESLVASVHLGEIFALGDLR